MKRVTKKTLRGCATKLAQALFLASATFGMKSHLASAVESAAAYYVGDGSSFDLALEVEGDGEARLYLVEKRTNAPVSGAQVTLQAAGAEDVSLNAGTVTGVYEGKLAPQSKPETVVIQTENDADAVSLAVPPYRTSAGTSVASPENGGTRPASEQKGILGIGVASVVGLGVLLGALLGAGTTYLLVRRKFAGKISKRFGASLLVLGLVTTASMGIVPTKASAHGGHDHGGEASTASGADASFGAAVVLAKRSQLLLGLRTVEAAMAPTPGVVQTFGHITPKPQNDAVIVAPQEGFVRGLKDLLPGKVVRRGEVLGYLQAVAQVPLTSPIDGEITEMAAVEGSRVEAGTKLIRVTNRSTLWVDVELFQAQLKELERVERIAVSVDGYDGVIGARLVNTPTPINEETRTAKVYVELTEAPKELRIGSFAKTHLILASRGEGIPLPANAVLNRAGERLVFVKTGPETFEPRAVNVIDGAEPGTIVVTSGVSAGELVVTTGNYQLLMKAK